MIDARGLTKRYGSTVAVDDLSFEVLPGRVTGFLGIPGRRPTGREGGLTVSLAAKTMVFTGVVLAVTTTACFAAFFIGQGMLSAKGISNGSDPSAARGATLSPWLGQAVFFLYAVVALGAAAVTLVRRDA